MAEPKSTCKAFNFKYIPASVESCLPKDAQGNFISKQEKSGVVHDLLAFLAEQMLEMNKQKQAEIKGSLEWLEGEVGAKVEDLTPKTKIQNTASCSFDELLAILKKNKRKIATDPARSRSRSQEERNLRRHKIEAEMEAVNGCENQPPAATSITGLIRQTNRHFAYLKLIST